MVQYRRSRSPGATYFFTVNLQNRHSTTLTDYVDLLRESFRSVNQQHPFKVIAVVILPDHLHTIWELPPNDSHYPKRWQAIKSRFTRKLVKQGIQLLKNEKGEYHLWQRRYWEHQIRDDDDLQKHLDYIHFNPVKHGHVICVKDWPHSSFHRYVKSEMLSKDWGGALNEDEDLNYGE